MVDTGLSFVGGLLDMDFLGALLGIRVSTCVCKIPFGALPSRSCANHRDPVVGLSGRFWLLGNGFACNCADRKEGSKKMRASVKICALLLIITSACLQTPATFGTLTPNLGSPAQSSEIASQQGEYTTLIDFTFPVVEPFFGYDLVGVEGCDFLTSPGQPLLPSRVLLVAVPPAAMPESAEALTMTTSVLDGLHKLPPAVRRFSQNTTIPEFVSYDDNATFPTGGNVRLLGSWTYRGIRLAAVGVIPLSYDASTGVVTFHDQVVIRLSWIENATASPDILPFNSSTDSFATSHFLNYDMIRGRMQYSTTSSHTDLLMVTTASYSSLFNAFIAEKASMGMSSKIMTVENIASSYTGRDLAEKIWNAIHALYVSDGIRYVLLGGSHSVVPGRYFWYDDDEGGWADRNLKLTDRYYGLMDDSNWDDDGDGHWGEKTEIWPPHGDEIGDWLQDVAVGRFPARTSQELTNMIQKTIMYERNPPASDRWNVMLLAGAKASDAWFGQGDGKSELQNLFTSWTSLHNYYSRNELYESDGTLSTGNLKAQLNGGVGVVTSVSHGSPYGLYLLSGSTWASTSDSLDTNTTPYFWYSYACLAAKFDDTSRSFGEYVVGSSSSGGAIAFVGSTRVSYGLMLYGLTAYDGANTELHTRFWNSFLGTGSFVPGLTLMYATNEMYSAAWGGVDTTDIHHTRKTLLEYVLLGDPTLGLHLSPTYPPSLSNGYVDPLDGSTSTTFNYWVYYSDPEGSAPSVKRVWIDGVSHDMTWYDGQASSGRYWYPTTLSAGNHNYYFEFSDGVNTVRLPTSGTYSGPTVSGGTCSAPGAGSGQYNVQWCEWTGSGPGGPITTNIWNDGPNVSFDWGNGNVDNTGRNSNLYAVAVGSFSFTSSGTWKLKTHHDDGLRVYIDGNKVYDNWGVVSDWDEVQVSINAGTRTVEIEYYVAGPPNYLSTTFTPPSIGSLSHFDLDYRGSGGFENPDGDDAHSLSVSAGSTLTLYFSYKESTAGNAYIIQVYAEWDKTSVIADSGVGHEWGGGRWDTGTYTVPATAGTYKIRAVYRGSSTPPTWDSYDTLLAEGTITVTGGPDTYTKLLLHMDGTAGSQTFVDSSPQAHSITANGNARIDTAQSGFGGASGLFDGDGDYLSLADSDDWNFGSGAFTVDFWIRWNSLPAPNTWMEIYSQTVDDNNRIHLTLNLNAQGTTQTLLFESSSGGSTVCTFGYNPTFAAGTWYHIAIVRSGNTWYIFENGKLKATTTNSGTLPDLAASLFIGRYRTGDARDFNGWLDEFRISKGVARWTSNFTPPTAPY
jgi:hypothetical protein